MLLDLDFTSIRGRLEVRRIALEGAGEVSTEAASALGRLLVRLNMTHGLLVVTVASPLNPNRTSRWIDRQSLSQGWRELPRRWDETGENWSCTVRISPP